MKAIRLWEENGTGGRRRRREVGEGSVAQLMGMIQPAQYLSEGTGTTLVKRSTKPLEYTTW
jgi:hypothetical protein